jgi:hypothetical protein
MPLPTIIILMILSSLQLFLGIIDAFVANKHSIPDHGKRLLKVCKQDFSKTLNEMRNQFLL